MSSSPASQAAFSALSSKFAVTQKVVLAQQDYIKDLERKNALLRATAAGPARGASPRTSPTGAAASLPLTPSASQVAQLQRGVQHFRTLAEQKEREAEALREELQLLQDAGGLDGGADGVSSDAVAEASSKKKLQLRRQMVALQTKHALSLIHI